MAPPLASQWPSWCASLMPYWSARSAARWSEMSIVSRIGKPAVGARVTTGLPTLPPSESTRWSFSPERPRRYLSSLCSTPAWPILSPGQGTFASFARVVWQVL